MHIGRRNQLNITLDPVVRIDTIPYLSCTLQERHTPIADTQAKARRDAEGSKSVEGKKWGDGRVEVVLDPTTAPYWLALALGRINSSTPKDHLITQSPENEPLIATISRERNMGEIIEFLNSVVDTFELNFADDVAKLGMDIMSKYPTSPESPESPGDVGEGEDLTYYTFRNATVKVGDLESPEAMILIQVRELTLRIENGAEIIFLPRGEIRIVWKAIRVSGHFKLLFEDEVQLGAFADISAKQGLLITFEGEDSDKIEIAIPTFRVDNWSEEAGIDDLVEEGIDFVAEYDVDAEKTISAEVVNGVDRYKEES
ncbi:MAG: phage tail tube protein [Candidatus Nealsonbacteria bacterium]